MADEKSQHDIYFKNGLSLPQIQVTFLEQHLPAEVLKDMDLSQIHLESELLIDERLNHKIVDVLLSVPYKGRNALVYVLIEHQSSVEPMMALRLIIYVLLILQRWLRKQKASTYSDGTPLKLPTVFPFVYYNGEAQYKGPLVLADLFEDPETFTRMINGPMQVIDLHDVDTHELEHDAWSYVFHSLMKHAYNPEMRQILLDLIPHMRQIEKESSGLDFVVRSFKYLIHSAKGCKENDLADAIKLLTSSRGEIMTIMEQWLEYKDQAETANQRIAEIEREKTEAVKEAEAERQARAEIERERAKAEQRAAEAERRARAEIERERAEAEQREAEAELRARAEIERERAEAERKFAESKEREIRNFLATAMDVQIIADCLNVPLALVQRLKDSN